MNKWQDSSFSLKWTCVLSYLGELAIMKHDYRHEHSWDTNMETGHGHGDGYGTQKFSTWGYASFCFRIVFFFSYANLIVNTKYSGQDSMVHADTPTYILQYTFGPILVKFL